MSESQKSTTPPRRPTESHNPHKTPTKQIRSTSSRILSVSQQNLRVGPYQITKTLGIGSTGHVKLGTHYQTGQTVAVKFIPKDSEKNDSKKSLLKKKLEREITIMKIIKHPNVLQLLDVYETDMELLLVLEHVEGGELFDYIVQRGRLDEHAALSFFQQIIFGVDFVHRHRICHRDLKPENLLLDRNLNIKIADFGMANSQGQGKMLLTSCGSPHYASPQIIKGIQYNGSESDIWSCGIILFALLTGNLPFDDENIRKLLSKVKSGVFIIPSYVNPQAQSLIRQMLTVEAQFRISMPEVMQHPWFTSQTPKFNQESQDMMDLDSSDPIFDIDMSLVEQLNTLGYDIGETLESLSSAGYFIEKIIYRSLHDTMTRSADLNIDELHQLPESPRRRSQYQQDKLERDQPHHPVLIHSTNRQPSGNFWQPQLTNQDSSITITEDNTVVKDVHCLADSMYETPERKPYTTSRPPSPSKKSWFNTLFGKPDSHVLVLCGPISRSNLKMHDTCTRLKIRMQTVSTKDKTVIKCKYHSPMDEKVFSKFRIEITDLRTMVQFQHGSRDVFAQVMQQVSELLES